jgi:hypothetical protein
MSMVVFLLHYKVYGNPIKATVPREVIVYVYHYNALAVSTSWLKFHAELVSYRTLSSTNLRNSSREDAHFPLYF